MKRTISTRGQIPTTQSIRVRLPPSSARTEGRDRATNGRLKSCYTRCPLNCAVMATTSTRYERKSKSVLFDAWRVFLSLWYLGGSFIHFYCALYRPYIYARFGCAPLYPLVGRVWADFVMPHIVVFALLLAAFELAVVIFLLSRGRAVTLALSASLLFNLFLVQLGLGYSAVPGSLRDFVLNRLPNLLFILVQLPLFWIRFDRSPLALVRRSRSVL
jgi:hypothetical protein